MTYRKEYKQWYEDVYTELSDNGIWLRGGELNTINWRDFDNYFYHLLFVRLSTYRDTSESFTHKILYSIAGNVDDVFVDLAYLPTPDSCAIFDRDAVPWILGTNTKRNPLEFDFIGFSNSTILELINIPTLLKKSNIPLKKSTRLANEHIPLILLGGANSPATSLLYSHDPLIDGIFTGDDAHVITQIITICRDGKRDRLSKHELLNNLENVPGFFQPESKKSVKKTGTSEITERYLSPLQPVLFEKEQIGKGNIQISYGCPFSCGFCFECWVNRPYREIPAERIIRHAGELKAACGLDTVELTSFNFNIHSEINLIVNELSKSFHGVGLKSQRLDVLVKQPELVNYMHQINKTSLTISVEGISERLRKYLNKQLQESEIYTGLSYILNAPIRELKVFLIATGLEEQNDYKELDAFLEKILSLIYRHRSSPRIIFSVTPLVRFPFTPLEFEDAYPIKHMKPILNSIRSIIKRRNFEFRQSYSLTEYWFSQVMVRAGSEKILASLMRTIEQTGFTYYSGIPYNFYEIFSNFCAEAALSENDLLTGFGPDSNRFKPWKKIDTGVSEVQLHHQYEFLKKQLSRPKPDKTVPITPAHKEDQNILRDYTITTKTISFKKHAEEGVRLKISVTEKSRGLDRKTVGVAIARAIMMQLPEFCDSYLGFKNSRIQQTQSNWVTGDDSIELLWKKERLPDLLTKLMDKTIIAKINKNIDDWAVLHGVTEQKQPAVIFKVTSNYPFCEEGFTKYSHLQYTRHKTDKGKYHFIFSRQSLKKNLIMDIKIETRPDNKTIVSIIPGEKFDINDFLLNSFVLRNKTDRIRINTEVVLREQK